MGYAVASTQAEPSSHLLLCVVTGSGAKTFRSGPLKRRNQDVTRNRAHIFIYFWMTVGS